MPAHDLKGLRTVYEATDRELAGWTCDGSADCCRFDETGREPHLWPNEWALVSRTLAQRGFARRVLPLAGACPLLDRAGRCTVYDSRPFGCRTFLCDRAVGPTRRPPRAALVELGRKIVALSEGAEPCAGPRPLTRWLADSLAKARW
jgi:hypothetical protein